MLHVKSILYMVVVKMTHLSLCIGDVYYYHTVTLQTCWDRPLSYPSTPEPEDAGEFVECLNPKPYTLNPKP
jgi:hypothetical protein